MASWWVAMSRGSSGASCNGVGSEIDGGVSRLHYPVVRKRVDNEGPLMSISELRSRCDCGERLVVVCGHVIDLSLFADVHPGGKRVLEMSVCRDVTSLFFGVGDTDAKLDGRRLHTHSRRAFHRLLSRYKVARLKDTDDCSPSRVSARWGHSYADWAQMAKAGIDVVDGKNGEDAPGSTGQPVNATTGRVDIDTCVDMKRPIVGQIASLHGSLYERWIHSKPCTGVESPRFFQWEVMEVCSKSHWATVPLIWLPVALWALAVSLQSGQIVGALPRQRHSACGGILTGNALFVAQWAAVGYFLWSVLEYTIHRFLFHLSPKSKFGKTLHFIVHGCHHKFPMDKMRLVFPPVAAAPIALLLHMGLRCILPDASASATFAGLLIGYVTYDITHYALHSSYAESWACQLPYLKRLRLQHFHHHFVDDTQNFGITSCLLDLVLDTSYSRAADDRSVASVA